MIHNSRLFYLLLLIVCTKASSLDFDINDHVEIPAVCERLPSFTSPVDLSGACLSAQLAAESFPPLLPAANVLCQTLEGITAGIGVIQLEVNTAHEVCQVAMGDLQNQMFSGLNEFHNELSDIEDLIRRLNGIDSIEDLYDIADLYDDEYLGIAVDEWYELYEIENKPAKSLASINYYEQVAAASYLSENMLTQNVGEQIAYVESLQARSGNNITIKQSQDFNSRISAELVFQQIVFQQLLSEYLALESAQSMKKLQQQSYYQRLLNNE